MPAVIAFCLFCLFWLPQVFHLRLVTVNDCGTAFPRDLNVVVLVLNLAHLGTNYFGRGFAGNDLLENHVEVKRVADIGDLSALIDHEGAGDGPKLSEVGLFIEFQ